MKKLTPLVALAVLILAALACGQAVTPAPSAPSADVIKTAVSQTLAAAIGTAAAQVPLATETSPPAVTPTGSAPVAENTCAWNDVASREDNGFKLEIARVVIGAKESAGQNFSDFSSFADTPVVGELVFRITNNSGKKVSVYPDQGHVLVGSEQVNLFDYSFSGEFGDSISGEILPGAKVVGGIWFGLKHTPLDQFKSMSVTFDAPRDESFNSLGPDYKFDIDLSECKHDPLPADLK